MDGEHVFSAAIVLIMVCIALPYNAADSAAMDAALDLLQHMANRGNSNIRSKCQKLVQLHAIANGSRPATMHDSSSAGFQYDLAREVAAIQPQQPILQMPSFPQVEYDFSFLPLDVGHDDQLTWKDSYTNPHFNMDAIYIDMAETMLDIRGDVEDM
jgi:proline utilization trans-activator